jgi:hypothetical protein
VQRSQISPVGSSIDRTVQSANSSIQLLPGHPMFCIRHSYTQLQRWLHCAPCCKHCCMLSLCVLHALSMPVCMQSKSSLSRGSCLSTCSQCEVLLKILNLHITAATCGRPVMPSASGCSNMLPCTQCLQVEHSKHHHLECYTLAHTVACCLIVLASLPMWLQFSHSSTHEPRHSQGNTANLPMLHII